MPNFWGKAKIESHVHKLLDTARKSVHEAIFRDAGHLVHRIPETITVEYIPHPTCYGGWSDSENQKILLNWELLRDNGPAAAVDITAHEVAHIVVDSLFGATTLQPHGREWRSVARWLGANPKASHSFDCEKIGIRHPGHMFLWSNMEGTFWDWFDLEHHQKALKQDKSFQTKIRKGNRWVNAKYNPELEKQVRSRKWSRKSGNG